jgi:hypothetical protein
VAVDLSNYCRALKKLGLTQKKVGLRQRAVASGHSGCPRPVAPVHPGRCAARPMPRVRDDPAEKGNEFDLITTEISDPESQ